ncbi:hypothetical protein TcG_04863 [Trypanosoma cruzi]|uniref:Uncharacterized protein n=1 Tax=Trypanosoma cruzi Dm28c TaxID=1416333 RepID=V5BHM1_TRYCR|nr:hypothetical protein TCDM_05954 [Trypanosoma cruzi Dm28c]RNF18597.1 hypothetical protein TcG_04863 [Trypanosoma cruzi]
MFGSVRGDKGEFGSCSTRCFCLCARHPPHLLCGLATALLLYLLVSPNATARANFTGKTVLFWFFAARTIRGISHFLWQHSGRLTFSCVLNCAALRILGGSKCRLYVFCRCFASSFFAWQRPHFAAWASLRILPSYFTQIAKCFFCGCLGSLLCERVSCYSTYSIGVSFCQWSDWIRIASLLAEQPSHAWLPSLPRGSELQHSFWWEPRFPAVETQFSWLPKQIFSPSTAGVLVSESRCFCYTFFHSKLC